MQCCVRRTSSNTDSVVCSISSNKISFITTSDLPSSQQKDYQQTQAGSVRRVTDGSTEINLNSPINPSQQTFREQSNIHPLLPFAGDIIYEGRFGNSIRLGGTAKPKPPRAPLNDWSNSGENGNPITIIRNGQDPKAPTRKQSDEGWVPVVEDINKDLSSIYITSNQLIPISVKNFNYESYKNPPTNPDQYKQPQVLINSDRLVFNAKTDSILLSAEKSIFLGTTNEDSSVNIQSQKTVISSPLIKLGDKDATESIILGDKFLTNLEELTKALNTLCTALETTSLDWPAGQPVPASTIVAAAQGLKTIISGGGVGFLDKFEDYKSKVSKTK